MLSAWTATRKRAAPLVTSTEILTIPDPFSDQTSSSLIIYTLLLQTDNTRIKIRIQLSAHEEA
jgi:hypothetical protein